jgi:thioredoxin 2
MQKVAGLPASRGLESDARKPHTVAMTAETLQVVCPHDGAINRIPASRLGDAPRCGRCRLALFSGAPLELNAAGFERQVGRDELPLLVDFWAPWCGPCRMMAPAFQQATALLEPRMRVAKVNTEDEPALAARFAIRSIPTMILFAGGREVARHSGALTAPSQIAAWANSHYPAA